MKVNLTRIIDGFGMGCKKKNLMRLWFVVLAAGRMKDNQVRWGEEQMLEE